jgi:hypothetical protein
MILIAVVKRTLYCNSLIILLFFLSRYCRKQPEDIREQLFCMDCDILLASHAGLLILIEGVADPGCLSRIPDPDFYPSRIPDLGSRIQKQQQKRGVKKICCHTFFCSHKLTLSSQKYGFRIRDRGSGKNLFRIPNPGVKKALDPGSGSATLLIELVFLNQYGHC